MQHLSKYEYINLTNMSHDQTVDFILFIKQLFPSHFNNTFGSYCTYICVLSVHWLPSNIKV